MTYKPPRRVSGPVRINIAANGRLVIPAEIRERHGLTGAQEIILTEDQYGVHLATHEQNIRRVQDAFARFRRPGVSMVDELSSERREDARREEDALTHFREQKIPEGGTWHVFSHPVEDLTQETVVAVCKTKEHAIKLRDQYAAEPSPCGYFVRRGR